LSSFDRSAGHPRYLLFLPVAPRQKSELYAHHFAGLSRAGTFVLSAIPIDWPSHEPTVSWPLSDARYVIRPSMFEVNPPHSQLFDIEPIRHVVKGRVGVDIRADDAEGS
jgi:hypothetical protein